MKILFPTLLTMPSNKVHGIQVAHMCDGFVAAGAEVTFMVPSDSVVDDIFSHYNLLDHAQVVRIKTIGSVRWGRLGYQLRAFTFAVGCWYYARQQSYDLFFSREASPVLLCQRLSGKTMWEIHNEDVNQLVKKVLHTADYIVAISPALRDLSVSLGAPKENVSVVVNAVSADRFEAVATKTQIECRTAVGLPSDKKLVMFTGNAVGWKGVETLAAATQYLPTDTQIVFVGRVSPEMKERLNSVADTSKLLFIGEKSYTDMPLYQRSADVLVLPTSGKTERARLYTSPIKLFEYLLSGTPIVATDIESTRAVVTEAEVTFAAPDDPESLAKACMDVLENPLATESKTKAAMTKGQNHTWPKRAQSILETIEHARGQ